MSIYEASITNPKKQLEFYKDLSEQLQQKNKNLQQRISKAIEYINERTIFNEYSAVYPSVLDANEVKRILKILGGKE